MYSTTGIILKKYPAGEADAVFSIYTKDYGKIRALAQGVKKEEAKLKGHLEIYNLTNIGFVLGKNGERLTQAVVAYAWPNIRKSWRKISCIAYVIELVDKYCLVGQHDESLWKLIVSSLLELEKMNYISELPAYKEFITKFESDFLHVLGYSGEKDFRILGEKPVAKPFGLR